MQGFTITPRLDEEDSSPVYEVKSLDGNFATNCLDMNTALVVMRECLEGVGPAKTLEEIAATWVRRHGTAQYSDMYVDVLKEADVDNGTLTGDQIDSILNMIEHAEVTVTFPFGHGIN